MEILIVSVFFTLIICTPITLISYVIKKLKKMDTSKQVKYLKRQGIAYIILLVIAALFVNDESTLKDNSSEMPTVTQTVTLTPTPAMSAEEEMKSIKEQAIELDYKTVFRNPNEYIGKYFVVDVKILTVENGSWLSGYEKAYKSYTNDEYDMWFGNMIYLVDNREETEYGYVKILEDDIIRVWGKFDGLIETKNALNGTRSEEMSLNVLYTELISE